LLKPLFSCGNIAKDVLQWFLSRFLVSGTSNIGVGIMSSNKKNLFFPNLDMDRIMGLIGLIESNDTPETLKAEEQKRTLVIEPMKRRRPQNVETLLRNVLNN
jgi:hypothetical protein